ncbi:MAG TPA: hypothetical protein VL326_28590 [Kofleriaceae bacterium]|nr:hypothetical protein [Kofleriaceae bacterium]
MPICRLGGAIVIMLAVWVVSEVPAHGQGAWTPPEKSLTVDFAYQYVPSSSVVIDPDISVSDRNTQNHIFMLSGVYVPIEKLAVEAGVPFGLFKYTSTAKHTPPGEWDDGSFHASLTDLRVGARYQVLEEPILALSPHIGFSIPLMDYEVLGFATGGRHLKTLHIGASVGRSFDPVLPDLYFTGTYEFSIAERSDLTSKTDDIKQRRSDISAEIGYLFLDGKLNVNLAMNARFQHGGINFADFAKFENGMPVVDPELINNHDPILNEDFWFLGGGVSYEITDRITAAVIIRRFIRGYNTRDQDLYGLNITWDAIP